MEQVVASGRHSVSFWHSALATVGFCCSQSWLSMPRTPSRPPLPAWQVAQRVGRSPASGSGRRRA